MESCASIIESLRQTARDLYGVDINGQYLRPLNDIDLGDLSSDICLKLAAQLKRDVPEIAAEMLAALNAEQHKPWSTLHGYLNVRLTDSELTNISTEQSALHQTGERCRIIVPAPGGDSRGLPHLRLISLAFLHLTILGALGHPARLECGDLVIESVADLDWAEQYRQICDHAFNSQARPAELRDVVDSLLKGSPIRSYVWMPVERLNHGDLAEFYRSTSWASRLVRFRCPPRSWIHQIDTEQPALANLGNWSDSELKSLLIYLCSDIPGTDIDLYVPKLSESANARWYFSTLLDRAETLRNRYPALSKAATTSSSEMRLTPGSRALLSRLTFLDTFLRLAAQEGDCVEFMTALDRTLHGFSRYLNDPALRIALENGSPSRVDLAPFFASQHLLESAVLQRLLL
jgi:hypothetical protein